MGRLVASCDTATIRVSNDADLVNGVARDASYSVRENRVRVVVCKVKLAERQ